MKDLPLAVITYLKANGTLCSASNLGASPNQRIYRASLPLNPTWPCMTVHLIDTKRLNLTHNNQRVAESRIQCTTYSSTDASGNAIAELVADILHGVDNTHLGVGVHAIRVDDAGGAVDANPDIGKYLYHRDFLIQHYY